MAPDLKHLEPLIHAVLSDLIPKGGYLRREALLDVPGHWTEQVTDLVGDVGLPLMARDGEAVRSGNQYRLDMHLRSLNGSGALIRLYVDLMAGTAADPGIVRLEGPDGKPDVPVASRLRASLAGDTPVPMPELAFVKALRKKMLGTPYQAVGDNIVRIGAAAPGFRLIDALRLADEFGTTLAIPTAEARDLAPFGFVPQGRWSLRPRDPVPATGPADPRIPLAEGTFAGAEPPEAPKPQAPPRRKAPPPEAASPAPERRFPPPVPYRKAEAAIATLLGIVGDRSKSLTQTLSELGPVVRSGGTSSSHARLLQSLGTKHFREVWFDLVPMPLARVRGNDLARETLRALPDFDGAPSYDDALAKMRAILADLPEGTTTADVVAKGVRMLEAGSVMLAALDHACQAPLNGTGGPRLDASPDQPDGVAQCRWIKAHLASLCKAHLSVDHVRELAGVVSPHTDMSPWKTVRDPLTWLFANVPDAKVEAMSLRRGEGAKGVTLIEISHGGTDIRIESRYDLDGWAQATRAWVETPKGRVAFVEGDEVRPLLGLKRMAAREGRSHALAADIRGYEALAGMMPVPTKADGLLVVARLGVPKPEMRAWHRLFALADEHEVTLRIDPNDLMDRVMEEELDLRRSGRGTVRVLVRDPEGPGPGPGV